MTTDALRPCPFCGGSDVDKFIGVYGHGIECLSCHATSGQFRSEQEPMEAWNRRQPAQPVAERVREACARAADSVGRPVGAGDGATYIPGSSSDAARAIRALKREGEKP